MAGKISSLLDPTRISLSLRSTERTAALNETAQLMSSHPSITHFDSFYRELLARDRLETTCIGHGIALPHARTEHVKSIVLAVGRSPAGIPFDNGHGANDAVHLLFMIGTPKNKPGDYLSVVSALCKLFKDPANRAALTAATTPEEFIRGIAAAETKLGL